LILDGPSGYQLTNPVLGEGDGGGVIVAAKVAATSADVRTFSVQQNGEVAWVGSYEAPLPQYARAVASDGRGGALVVAEDQPVFPPTRNRWLLLKFSASGLLQYAVPFADTLDGGRSGVRLWVEGGVASAIWNDARPDSSGVWWQRFDVQDGRPLHPGYGRRVSAAPGYGAALSADGIYLYAGAQLYLLADGAVQPRGVGVALSPASVAPFSGGVAVAGVASGVATVQLFSDGAVQWSDTAAAVSGWPREVNVVPHGAGLLVTYRSDTNLWYRCYADDGSSTAAQPVCTAPNEQYAHRTLDVGDDVALVAWYDTRSGQDVYIQHIRGERQTWDDGVRLGAVTPTDEFPPIGACQGQLSGWVAWSTGGEIYLQPGDTVHTDAGPNLGRPEPTSYSLSPAYPNPFNGATQLNIQLAKPGMATVAVYNMLGQRVATLHDGRLAAGIHPVQWQPDVTSGTYYIYLRAGGAGAVQAVRYIK
jgi:hypothetical protein